MDTTGIPEEVKRFINDHIESLDQLEILLLLRKHAGQAWSAEQVSRELRNDPNAAAERLMDLSSRGILVTSGQQEQLYKYQPKTAEMEQAITLLAEAYAVRRVTVITMIFSKPSTHVLSFADAFKFRRDKKDG